ncbi:hypothetical protein [Bosea sp. 685]|nr:hypothetical protein [Bosea sp. 685]WNJ92022.1 hypothetical protein RMR04_06885 [Bosea sp. 685]
MERSPDWPLWVIDAGGGGRIGIGPLGKQHAIAEPKKKVIESTN